MELRRLHIRILRISAAAITLISLGYLSNRMSTDIATSNTKKHILDKLHAAQQEAIQLNSMVREKYKVKLEKSRLQIPELGPFDDSRVMWIIESAVHEAPPKYIRTIFGVKFPVPWFLAVRYYPPMREYQEPWASIVTRTYDIPFLLTQHYGWMYAGMWGRGGIRYYISAFGRAYMIKDRYTWIS